MHLREQASILLKILPLIFSIGGLVWDTGYRRPLTFTDRAAAQMVFDMEIAWLLGYFVSFAVYRVCIVG